MRLAAAIIAHETNTFSPVPTRLSDFGPAGPLYGDDALRAVRGRGRSMSGMLDVAEREGAQVDLCVFGTARPARAVDRDAFEEMTDALCATLRRGGYDGLLLEMHGAMVTEHLDDGEGEIMRRVREIAPALPVAVALDFHANLSSETVAASTVLTGYKTFPHLDIRDTGAKTAELFFRSIRGEVRPASAHLSCRIVQNMLRQVTDEGAMAEIMALARAEEEAGALDVSVFGGFSLADCAFTGMSVVATTDGDPAEAAAICERIRAACWERRDRFQTTLEPLAETIAEARRLGATHEGAPIVLADTADNCHSGGSQDSMDVIAEALRQGLDGIVAGPIADPVAVEGLCRAGRGATVELMVGGGTDFGPIGGSIGPLTLAGTVTFLGHGRFEVAGPVFTGMEIDLGRVAVLENERLRLLVSERRCEPLDLAMFQLAGIEPREARFVIVKSKVQFRPTFGAIAAASLLCHGVGYATLDLERFPFRRVQRPVHPFDA